VAILLKRPTLIELEPATVEVADLRVEGGRIVARGPDLSPVSGDDVVDLEGKVVAPGLVSAHHRLHHALRRGLGPLDPSPGGYEETLRHGRWRFEEALDLDAVQTAGTAGALEALCFGTTTVIDLHASPGAIEGSLLRLARGINEVGLRAVLSYEVTDRFGALAREAAIDENVGFQKKARGRFRGLIGAHACFTLSHDALQGLAEAVRSTGSGVHLALAEDPCDEKLSFERYGAVPVNRLFEAGLLSPTTLAVHVGHLSWPELAQVVGSGTWLVHTPRADMERQAGYAPAGKFGSRGTLGSGGLLPDMFAEAQYGHLRSRDAGQQILPLRYLANAHRIASQIFGEPIGPLREGAVADLLVLDYRPITPLTPETLGEHLLGALSARHVESVMVDGHWRLWARRPLSVDAAQVALVAQETGRAVAARVAAAR
jgi:cytosine/adenosine deaminase-related metal-dependent hydrolase